MGVDTHIIIENRLAPNELISIADRLNGDPHLAALMREYDRNLRRVSPGLVNLIEKPWKLELFRAPLEIDPKLVESGSDAGYLMECRGPFGSLCVYGDLADISWSMCSWYAFLKEPAFRTPLFEATRLISTIFNPGVTTTALFLPDSGDGSAAALDEVNRTMPELLAWLRDKCRPPAKALESIVHEDQDDRYVMRAYHVTRLSASGTGN